MDCCRVVVEQVTLFPIMCMEQFFDSYRTTGVVLKSNHILIWLTWFLQVRFRNWDIGLMLNVVIPALFHISHLRFWFMWATNEWTTHFPEMIRVTKIKSSGKVVSLACLPVWRNLLVFSYSKENADSSHSVCCIACCSVSQRLAENFPPTCGYLDESFQ